MNEMKTRTSVLFVCMGIKFFFFCNQILATIRYKMGYKFD